MDCLEAQRTLSEAVDREPVSAEALAEARKHCLGCAECARFVRGLALLQRAASPEAPREMHDRVMGSIREAQAATALEPAARAQAARSSESQGALPARAGTVTAATSDAKSEAESAAETTVPSTTRPSGLVTPLSAARKNARRRSMIAWAGAAAAVLIVAGFAAVWGVRNIVAPTGSPRVSSLAPNENSSDRSAATTPPNLRGFSAEQPTGSAAPLATKSVAVDYITVNDFVYRSAGTVALARSELTTAGTTDSALNTGGAVSRLTVYATPTSGRIAIVANGQTLAFDIVSRQFGGETFMLTSKPITAFNVWPSLPSGFIEPTTADGAPTFVQAGKDDLGVPVYSRPGIPVTDGFAIAPQTPQSDPAQGDPNWTWWSRPTP